MTFSVDFYRTLYFYSNVVLENSTFFFSATKIILNLSIIARCAGFLGLGLGHPLIRDNDGIGGCGGKREEGNVRALRAAQNGKPIWNALIIAVPES